MYACFCNGYGLLLHNFVNGDPVNIGHFVEFVYTYDTSVREDHGPGFQSPFSRFAVGRHSSGKTDTGTSSTSGRDRKRRNVQHEAKHLRFGGGGISNHEHVDVTTDMGAIWEVLLRATEEKEEYC